MNDDLLVWSSRSLAVVIEQLTANKRSGVVLPFNDRDIWEDDNHPKARRFLMSRYTLNLRATEGFGAYVRSCIDLYFFCVLVICILILLQMSFFLLLLLLLNNDDDEESERKRHIIERTNRYDNLTFNAGNYLHRCTHSTYTPHILWEARTVK